MNNSFLRSVRLLNSFSKKKDVFTNKPIWNPRQNVEKQQEKQQETTQVQEEVQQSKVLFKSKIQTFEIKHGMFLDTKKPFQSTPTKLQDKINQLKLQSNSPLKFASLIEASSELDLDFEEYYTQANIFLKIIDPLVLNAYFKAIQTSQGNNNKKKEQLKQIIMTHHRQLEVRCLVMYYELIFKTTNLPSEKALDLQDLLMLIKRNNIKITTFDIANFCYIFNHELFKQHENSYESCVKVFADYVEYVCSAEDFQARNLPNITVAFQICRLVSEKYGMLFQIDPCLRIIKAVGSQYEVISSSELALWTNKYLRHDKGLQVVIEALKKVETYSFGKELDKVVTSQSLRSASLLRSQYQQLRPPFSVAQLDVIAIVAERTQDWHVLADIYQMYPQYTKNKNRSQVVYLCSISMALDLKGNNHVDSVGQLISKAQRDSSNLTRIQSDIANVKAMIKDGKYDSAFSFFRNHVIDETIIEYQRERIRQFLIKYVEFVASEHNNREIDQNSLKKANIFANNLSKQILEKLYVEDMSDNQVMEALTFSNSPWDFWEAVQKYKDFQWLRQECLQQTLDPQLLINLSTDDTFWVRRREVLENYEQYIAQEKQTRIANRKNARILKVVDELQFGYTADYEDEELMNMIEKEIGPILDQGLFGKIEDEFPELDFMNKIRDQIRVEEKKQNKEVIAKEPQENFEPQETQQDVQIPENPKKNNLSPEASLDYWLEDPSQPFPQLDQPFLRERFIQLFYTPAQFTNDFDNYQMIPDFNTKPYLQRFLSLSNLDEMRLRYWDVYKQGLEYVNAQLPSQNVQNEIWRLVEWGIQNDEPMAIKLGEFYGQHVGQAAPIEITKLVANYYKYQLRVQESQRKYDEAYAIVGPSNIKKVYNSTDPVFAKPIDYEILNQLEFNFEFRGHARGLLKTSYSQQKYVRNGVTPQDVLQSIRLRQAVL